jgi:hypothetical protein
MNAYCYTLDTDEKATEVGIRRCLLNANVKILGYKQKDNKGKCHEIIVNRPMDSTQVCYLAMEYGMCFLNWEKDIDLFEAGVQTEQKKLSVWQKIKQKLHGEDNGEKDR